MKLTEYLDGMRAAGTADELEAAIQAPFKHSFRGRTWSQICGVRIQRGVEICDLHPHGRLVPRLGARRLLTVADETYRVGNGQNSTGVRYCWHYAGEWAKGVLRANGMSQRAAYAIWEGWSDYPHRVLRTIDAALAGELQDPPFDQLLLSHVTTAGPIRYTVEQNVADSWDRRASRPCPSCGGTLFDWGCGGGWATFINWHCNGCSNVYVEYVTQARLSEIRVPRFPSKVA
jgi:hypothetical protein